MAVEDLVPILDELNRLQVRQVLNQTSYHTSSGGLFIMDAGLRF